ALAEQHAHSFVVDRAAKEIAFLGHGEVGDAVTIEIAHRYGPGVVPGTETWRRREGAVAFPQEYADGAASIIGHGKVEATVAVEVPSCHGPAFVTGAELPCASEATVAIAQQDAYRASIRADAATIGHGQVESAISVEVSHAHSPGKVPRTKGSRSRE